MSPSFNNSTVSVHAQTDNSTATASAQTEETDDSAPASVHSFAVAVSAAVLRGADCNCAAVRTHGHTHGAGCNCASAHSRGHAHGALIGNAPNAAATGTATAPEHIRGVAESNTDSDSEHIHGHGADPRAAVSESNADRRCCARERVAAANSKKSADAPKPTADTVHGQSPSTARVPRARHGRTDHDGTHSAKTR